MKKSFMIALLIGLFFTGSAFAGESSCPSGYKQTLNKWGHSHCYIDTDTDTDTDTLGDPQDEAGVGADVVLWQNEKQDPWLEEVVAEYRYDADNKTHATYGVVRLNLWNAVKENIKKDK